MSFHLPQFWSGPTFTEPCVHGMENANNLPLLYWQQDSYVQLLEILRPFPFLDTAELVRNQGTLTALLKQSLICLISD